MYMYIRGDVSCMVVYITKLCLFLYADQLNICILPFSFACRKEEKIEKETFKVKEGAFAYWYSVNT